MPASLFASGKGALQVLQFCLKSWCDNFWTFAVNCGKGMKAVIHLAIACIPTALGESKHWENSVLVNYLQKLAICVQRRKASLQNNKKIQLEKKISRTSWKNMRFFMEVLNVFWSLKQLCCIYLYIWYILHKWCFRYWNTTEVFFSAMPLLYPTSPFQKRVRRESVIC